MSKSGPTFLLLLLAGLWLSATAFFISPKNFAVLFHWQNNAAVAVSSNQPEKFVFAAPDFQSLGAAFWGIVSEALAATDDLTVVKSGGNGVVYNRYGGGLIFGCGFNCPQIVTPAVIGGGGSKYYSSIYALPAPDSDFISWSGCDSLNGAQVPKYCGVTYTGSAKTVTANFAPLVANNILTITKSGSTGLGVISLTHTNINDSASCGNNCLAISSTFKSVKTISMTATADTASGSTFTGWGGDAASCGSASPCSLIMNGAKNVTANFTSATPPAAPAAVYKLTVKKSGPGLAAMTSGLKCNYSCLEVSVTFYTPQSVSIVNTFGTNSFFTSWTGCDTSGSTGCTVSSVNGVKTVTLASDAQVYSLDVDKTGSGQGTITSTSGATGWYSGDINCGPTCNKDSEVFQNGSQVTGSPFTATLSAAAVAGSNFTGWFDQSGAVYPGCSGTGTCVVTMDNHKRISANFNAVPQTLTVNKTGSTGSGAISGTVTTGTGPDIVCNAGCATANQNYNFNNKITLTANPSASSNFTGWTGDCDAGTGGAGTCVVTMSAAKTVTAVFAIKTVALNIYASSVGLGKVHINSPSRDCWNNDCAATPQTYNYGDVVILSEIPRSDGSTVFTGWSGDCSGNSNTCSLTMNGDKTVYATFISKLLVSVAVNPNNGASGDVVIAGIASPGIWSGAMEYSWLFGGFLDESRYGVDSSNFGLSIACPASPDNRASASCLGNYNSGDTVLLAAWAFSGYHLDSWSGCESTGIYHSGADDYSTCTVTKNSNVTAVFKANINTASLSSTVYPLSVNKTGSSGTGVVSGSGINCGSTCSVNIAGNVAATLTAQPDSGSVLDHWVGCDSVDYSANPPACTAYSGNRPVTGTTAVYPIPADTSVCTSYQTNIYANNNSDTSKLYGPISQTSPPYYDGQQVACSVAGPYAGTCTIKFLTSCMETVYGNKIVSAIFKLSPATLTVIKQGSGEGLVTGPVGTVNGVSGDGIWCGQNCGEEYSLGASAVLTGTPASGSGVCIAGTCTAAPANQTFTMNTSQTATFIFNRTILNVVKIGNGFGLIKSYDSSNNPTADINCGLNCYKDYGGNSSQIRLQAFPDASSTFIGWTGCDVVSGGFCIVYSNDIRNVIARFDAFPAYGVSVFKAGLGKGSVTGSDGLVCDANCSQTYKIYSGSEMAALAGAINLSPAPDANSIFDGWTGCDSVSGTNCVLTANNINKVVTAIFNPSVGPVLATQGAATSSYTININKSGSGSITGLAGVDCSAGVLSCSKTFGSPTTVSLNASSSAGYNFAGWGGDVPSSCIANPAPLSCSVDLVCSRALTVSKTGTGSGIITGTGISCGADCSESYSDGASVTLTAAPDPGSVLTSWSGCDSINGSSCVLTMNKDKNATANFEQIPFSISAAPSSLSVTQGQSISSTITINKLSGSATYADVYVLGVPANVTAAWNPANARCDFTANTCSLTLTFTTSGSASPGSYSIPVTGTVSGISSSLNLNLTITGFDYNLSATPNSASVSKSGGTNIIFSTIKVTKTSDPAQSVTLTASGAPTGVTIDFGYSSAGPFSGSYACAPSSGSCFATMRATIIPFVTGFTTGTYPITITGTSGSIVRSTTYTLTINP